MGLRGKITLLSVSFMILLPMTSWSADPIKLFIAGTSGAEDTQSMGHFEFAKRLDAASDGIFKAEVKINAVLGETDDDTEQAAIVRVNHTMLVQARAAIAHIKEISDAEVRLDVARVSGTIKTLKSKL